MTSIFPEKKVSLYYKDARSDKEYHLSLEPAPFGGWKVVAKYGPRGGTLTHVDLTRGLYTTYPMAMILFNKREQEKRAKGYVEADKWADLKRRLAAIGINHVSLGSYKLERLCQFIDEYVEERV